MNNALQPYSDRREKAGLAGIDELHIFTCPSWSKLVLTQEETNDEGIALPHPNVV